MSESYFWCQIPGNDLPCDEAEDAGREECLHYCADHTLEQWARFGDKAAIAAVAKREANPSD